MYSHGADLKDRIFKKSQGDFDKFTDTLLEKKTQKMKLDEVERLVKNKGQSLQRTLLEEHIASRGTGDIGATLTGHDGIERSYKRLSTRNILTLFGTVKIVRTGYFNPGVASVFPLDAQLNLPDHSYSYFLQKMVVLEAIKGSFDEVVESMDQSIGIRISKGKSEAVILRASQYFYDYYRDKTHHKELEAQSCEADALLVITIDGKGIAMRKAGLRDATRKKAEAAPKNTKQRLSPGEKKNQKRMAAVASVYCIHRFKRTSEEIIKALFEENFRYQHPRPKPIEKRVWASVEKNFEETVQELFQEASKRDPARKLTWIALVDGDGKQITYLKKHAKSAKIDLTIICDFIHVLEYLWSVAHVFFEDMNIKEQWIMERLDWLFSGKASVVAASMRRAATRQQVIGNARATIDKSCNYLLNLSQHLKYDEYIKNGYPIATGIIEGACRYLVQDRMGKTGARWGLEGAEAILKLRSLKASHELDDYWEYYKAREFERIYRVIPNDQIDQIIVN